MLDLNKYTTSLLDSLINIDFLTNVDNIEFFNEHP